MNFGVEFNFGWSPKQSWHSIVVFFLGIITAFAAYGFYSYTVNLIESSNHTVGVVRDSIFKKMGRILQ